MNCTLCAPTSMLEGTESTSAKDPSALVCTSPSNVGVECSHTSTGVPGIMPAPSTRNVLSVVIAIDPFDRSGSIAPVLLTEPTIMVASPRVATTCCFSTSFMTTSIIFPFTTAAACVGASRAGTVAGTFVAGLVGVNDWKIEVCVCTDVDGVAITDG